MPKPILLAMDEATLDPHVKGSAGERLAGLLGLGPAAYLWLLDRAGVPVPRENGWWTMFKGRLVLVLGHEVREACGLHAAFNLVPYYTRKVHWRLLPDPSLRNQWYNDPARRAAVRLLLQELAGAQPHPEDIHD